MSLYEEIRKKIFRGHQPYAGFPVKDWAGTWYSDPRACCPIFHDAIDLSCPGVIVEVGSFVGESTIFMAKALRQSGREGVVVAIDTWGGGKDHWEKVPEKLRFWFGRPSLYYQFIGNVMAHGVQDMILPLAVDSMTGARILVLLGIVPNMVYLDASHEEGDNIRDMEMYWALLPRGGVLLADDDSRFFPGVQHDQAIFRERHGKPVNTDQEKNLYIKP